MPSIFRVGSIISSILWLAVASVRADLLLDGGDEFGWDTTKWRVQVDGVMGGESSGFLRFDNSDSVMDFSGNIILDGGGFSSVRKERFSEIDLTEYAGIVIQLEAVDAPTAASVQPPLGLHLQFHDSSSRYGFASAFAIPLASAVGEEIKVYLPLESFDRGSRMGFQCNNCQLDYSSINEIDIYVLFQDGPFQVRVKSIAAVENPQSFPSPVISVASSNEMKELVESTIESGGKLYDYSYGELCVAVYRSTLNTIFAASGDDISDTLRGLVCEGILRASTYSSIPDIAWTLRYTLDGVIEHLGYSDPDEGEGWRPDVETALSFSDQCIAVTSTHEEITEEAASSGILYPDFMVSQSDEGKAVRAGVVIGVVVGVLLCLLIAVYCCFKRSRSHHSRTDLDKPGTEEKQTDSSISLGGEGGNQPSSDDEGPANLTKTEML